MDFHNYFNYVKYYASLLYDNLKPKDNGIVRKHSQKKIVSQIVCVNKFSKNEITIYSKDIHEHMTKFINYDKDSKDNKERGPEEINKTCKYIVERIKEIVRNEVLSKIETDKMRDFTESTILIYDDYLVYVSYIFYDTVYFICFENFGNMKFHSPRSFKKIRYAHLDFGNKKTQEITKLIAKFQGPFCDFHTDYSRPIFSDLLNVSKSIYKEIEDIEYLDKDTVIKILYEDGTERAYYLYKELYKITDR